jgi:hypothetical protein
MIHRELSAEVVSLSERIELPEVAPVVTQHRRLAVQPQSEQVGQRRLQPLVGERLEGLEIGRHRMQPWPGAVGRGRQPV